MAEYPISHQSACGSDLTNSTILNNERTPDTLTLYRCILDSIPDAIVVHQEGRIQFANRGAVQLMALPDDVEPSGMSIWSFFHPSTRGNVQDAFKDLSSDGRIGDSLPTAQHTIVRHDGTIFIGEIRSILINSGDYPVVMSITRDVSVEDELKKQLKHIAYHDSLTELPNRLHFTETLSQLLSDPMRSKHHHAVFFLDMDRFKNINDIYGHTFGDEALTLMGHRLQSMLPESCFLARIGGDEFAVVYPDVVEFNDVKSLADQFLSIFTSPFCVQGHEFAITPSIGIAVYPQCGEDVDTLLRHADLAMYTAKRTGGSKFDVYDPEDGDAIEERLRIEHGIRRGLETDQFLLHYQPKIDLKSGHLHSLEALVRWKTGDGDIVAPNTFIHIAEDSGLIAELGKKVLRQACYQNKRWQKQGYPPTTVSVNVSPRQFQLTKVQDTIREILKETNLSPEWLEIEITEGLLMHNSIEFASELRNIREMGVKISIDDFGTGYSSLNYLRLFKPNLLKIDQSFISNMIDDQGHMSIVTAVIQLAHGLDMKVVAEGVETDVQSSILRERDCDIAQGFFYSQPLLPEEIERLWFQT